MMLLFFRYKAERTEMVVNTCVGGCGWVWVRRYTQNTVNRYLRYKEYLLLKKNSRILSVAVLIESQKFHPEQETNISTNKANCKIFIPVHICWKNNGRLQIRKKSLLTMLVKWCGCIHTFTRTHTQLSLIHIWRCRRRLRCRSRWSPYH